MKRAKKIMAFLLATLMVMGMSMSVFAANITMDDEGAENSVYAAYQLLNAVDGSPDDATKITKIAYTVNEKYRSILETATGTTGDTNIINYIDGLDDTQLREFAEEVYKAITDAGDVEPDAKTNVDDPATNGVNEGDTTKVFENVPQGYYLIEEITSDGEIKSLVMLDTAGKDDISVKTKESVPTVEKDIVGGKGEKHDDVAVGDTVNFQITGTVSEQYANYKSYYYSFRDTMSDGLTLNSELIKVYVVNGESRWDVTATTANDVPKFIIDVNGNDFTATANLKELDVADDRFEITATTKIVVEYSATVNANAVSGATGNPNEVTLSYENDPYHEADSDPNDPADTPDEPGVTPSDVTVVFTFDVIVDKTDGTNPLTGAGFTLYEKTGDGPEDWTIVGAEITGAVLTQFTWSGLDAGTYKIVETTVPEGYNKADDVEFTIDPNYDDQTKPVTLTSLAEINNDLDKNDDKVTFEIVNNAGSLLPSTGGMGTTIFYVVGGVLVLVAVVLLVTRKRMKED